MISRIAEEINETEASLDFRAWEWGHDHLIVRYQEPRDPDAEQAIEVGAGHMPYRRAITLAKDIRDLPAIETADVVGEGYRGLGLSNTGLRRDLHAILRGVDPDDSDVIEEAERS